MADGPRQNDRMLNQVERTYETALYVGDQGLWTVIEVTRQPILKAPSQGAAEGLIRRLKKADGGSNG